MKLLYPSDLINMPPPEWILKEVVQTNSTTLLYGPSGLGKSFLALEMAFAVASDQHNIFTVARPGPVIYVAGEGVMGIGVRVKAWQQDRGMELSRNVAVLGQPVQLADKRSRKKFIEMVKADFGDPILIIFDTLARCAVGLDENSARDMGLVVEGVDHIRDTFGATVILVHHSTKANPKSERGSGAIYGAVDTTLALNADGKKFIKLECQKQKNGEAAPCRSLELRPVGGLSCVIRADAETKAQTAREKFIETCTRGVPNSFTKLQFYEFAYPPIPFEWDGSSPIIAVTDPGGRRIILDPIEPDDDLFKEWLKDDLSYLTFPANTDWKGREKMLRERKAGKLKQLVPDHELEYWYAAIDLGVVSQTKVAEWYGLPRQTFIRHFKKWKG